MDGHYLLPLVRTCYHGSTRNAGRLGCASAALLSAAVILSSTTTSTTISWSEGRPYSKPRLSQQRWSQMAKNSSSKRSTWRHGMKRSRGAPPLVAPGLAPPPPPVLQEIMGLCNLSSETEGVLSLYISMHFSLYVISDHVFHQ